VIVIIDEAQNLPLSLLEQIRILSNLETDKEKLLQIVLVGQLNLQAVLRAPDMRQLDQRVSIRYELKPLNRDEAAAYVAHRLAIAGGSANVSFTPRALDLVHRLTGGTPRLINLVCDRALLGGYSERTNRITPEIVTHAAASLDLVVPRALFRAWVRRHVAMITGGVGVLAVAALAGLFAQQGNATGMAGLRTGGPANARAVAAAPAASYSILVGSFQSEADAEARASELQHLGFSPYRSAVNAGDGSRWLQVLVGRYTDAAEARADEARLRRVSAFSAARVVLD
jgi:general secretion pathway protein A